MVKGKAFMVGVREENSLRHLTEHGQQTGLGHRRSRSRADSEEQREEGQRGGEERRENDKPVGL